MTIEKEKIKKEDSKVTEILSQKDHLKMIGNLNQKDLIMEKKVLLSQKNHLIEMGNLNQEILMGNLTQKDLIERKKEGNQENLIIIIQKDLMGEIMKEKGLRQEKNLMPMIMIENISQKDLIMIEAIEKGDLSLEIMTGIIKQKDLIPMIEEIETVH